jgi:hypothetical protein
MYTKKRSEGIGHLAWDPKCIKLSLIYPGIHLVDKVKMSPFLCSWLRREYALVTLSLQFGQKKFVELIRLHFLKNAKIVNFHKSNRTESWQNNHFKLIEILSRFVPKNQRSEIISKNTDWDTGFYLNPTSHYFQTQNIIIENCKNS